MSASIRVVSHEKDVQKDFEKRIEKALTEIGLVAERYAKEMCPVDTGNLRGSINNKPTMVEQAVYIGTNVEYAPYVELGTSRQGAQPYLKPAVANHLDEYQSLVKKAFS